MSWKLGGCFPSSETENPAAEGRLWKREKPRTSTPSPGLASPVAGVPSGAALACLTFYSRPCGTSPRPARRRRWLQHMPESKQIFSFVASLTLWRAVFPPPSMGEGLYGTWQIMKSMKNGISAEDWWKQLLKNVKTLVVIFAERNFFEVVLFFQSTALYFCSESMVTVNWPKNEEGKKWSHLE